MKASLLAFIFFTKFFTASSEKCPEGWVEVMEMGCLHFGSESSTWFEASSYCEEIHPNGSMIEILSQEENDLVSLVGNVLVTTTDVDSWWIGLEDIGHEGVWEWQPSSTVASYFSWGYDKPSSDPVNTNDCVFMSPNPLDNDFVWTDSYCDYLDDSSKIAPLCQIKDASSPSTTSTSPLTTTEELTTTSQRLCPESYDQWEWVPFDGNCYKLVNNTLTFDEAQTYCSVGDDNGDLLSIHSPEENDFVGTLLRNNNFETQIFIGGFVTNKDELCEENDDKWSWTDGTPWNYRNWYPNRPNCCCTNVDYLCTVLYANSDSGPQWFNDNCNDEYSFVCKRLQYK